MAVTIAKPANVVEKTGNRKLGQISATYMSQSSCPVTCPFYEAGCYANTGRMGIHTSRLNKSEITDPNRIAELEAEGIRKLTGTRPLRLGVVGDHKTLYAVTTVAAAAAEHTAKHGKPVYTYTHVHDIPREAWGSVSILRSCETIGQVKQAFSDGYAAAMVVPEFEKDTAYELEDGIVGIPCPEMTGKAESCDKCGLCMNDQKLRAGKRVILFAAHGASKKRVQNSLRELGDAKNVLYTHGLTVVY